jgi:hypothetical protein
MKPEITLLFAFFSLGGFVKPVFSQDLHEGNLLELTTADHLLIQEELSDSSYQVFHFPYTGLNYSLKETVADSALTIQFKIDSLYDWRMTLEENEIRSGNYLLAATVDTTGIIVWQKSREVNTYKGFINGDTSQWVAMYISSSRMGGLFNFDGDLLYLKPLMDFIPDSIYSHSFILYKAGSEKELGGFVCLTDDTIVDAGDTLLSPRSETERYLEYAVDVDKEFFDKYKNEDDNPTLDEQVEAVEDVVLRYIKDVHALYLDAANLEIQLVYLHIWTTGDDPYSGNIQDHWDQLQSHWNGPKGCVNKDAGVLLSGKNLSPDGYVNYWGFKSICGIDNPSYCPMPLNGYAVIEDNNKYSSAIIAHELGHNLGLGHYCTIYANSPEQGQTTCNVMWTGDLQEGCPGCPDGLVLRFDGNAEDKLNGTLESERWTCIYNEEEKEWELGNGDFDICLRTPAPVDYEFNILLEPEQTILGDFPICENEFTLTFYNAFDQVDIEWGLGPNLTLADGTLNDLSINLEWSEPGPTYVTVSFEYNCENITFKREFNVGKPLEPGLPFFYPSPTASGYYNVGVPEVPGATYFRVSWEDGNPGSCDGVPWHPILVEDNDPLLTGFSPDNCLYIGVAAGNVCGLSDYTIFEWNNYSGMLINEQGNESPNKSKLNKADGMPAIQEQTKFTIKPNPANGNFFVHFTGLEIPSQIIIFDVMGQLVQYQDIEPGFTAFEIDTDGWDDGIFFVVIQSQYNQEVARVVVQKK